MKRLTKVVAVACLLVILGTVVLTGCRGQEPTPAPTSGIDLASTMVPNLDLDVYVYLKQEGATTIPKDLIGAGNDLGVESLAIWGVAQGEELVVAGALTMANAAEATRIQSQIPGGVVWTALADRTLYFVRGSGGSAENLKSAITRKDFKYFKDEKALTEVVQLPTGGNTKMAAVVVAKPSQPVLKLMSGFVDRQTASMLNGVVSAAKVEWLTAALYAPAKIDLANLARRLAAGSVWEMEMGMAASVKAGVPGFIIAPIAGKLLENAGYTAVTVGGQSAYKGNLDAGGGKSVPIYLSLVGERIFMAASAKDAYAQTLISGIKR